MIVVLLALANVALIFVFFLIDVCRIIDAQR
jgi:hypothetical protein